MWYKSSYGTPRGERLTPPRTRKGPVRSPRRAEPGPFDFAAPTRFELAFPP